MFNWIVCTNVWVLAGLKIWIKSVYESYILDMYVRRRFGIKYPTMGDMPLNKTINYLFLRPSHIFLFFLFILLSLHSLHISRHFSLFIHIFLIFSFIYSSLSSYIFLSFSLFPPLSLSLSLTAYNFLFSLFIHLSLPSLYTSFSSLSLYIFLSLSLISLLSLHISFSSLSLYIFLFPVFIHLSLSLSLFIHLSLLSLHTSFSSLSV